MKETKLTFRFHNRNSESITAKIFLETLMQANQNNIETRILHHMTNQETSKIMKNKTAALLASV